MMMAARVVVMAAAIVHDSRWHIGSAFDWYGTRGPCGHPTRPELYSRPRSTHRSSSGSGSQQTSAAHHEGHCFRQFGHSCMFYPLCAQPWAVKMRPKDAGVTAPSGRRSSNRCRFAAW